MHIKNSSNCFKYEQYMNFIGTLWLFEGQTIQWRREGLN